MTTRVYVFGDGEARTCQGCGAQFCAVPKRNPSTGRRIGGRPRRFCSSECSDYHGKGAGRSSHKRASDRAGAIPAIPSGPDAVADFFEVFDTAGSVESGSGLPPSWKRTERAHPHPIFTEWHTTGGHNPDEGRTAPAVGPVIGGIQPWNH